jgi:hypothetical protein
MVPYSGPTFVLMTPDAVAAVEISAQDVGYPDDPDGGRWLTIATSLDRTRVSKVLGAAAAISVGRLTASPIIDEETILTGTRIAVPDAAAERKRTPTAGVTHLRDICHPGPPWPRNDHHRMGRLVARTNQNPGPWNDPT